MVVLLHNIRSLHNVGSIFRTADAAGVKKIYLCGITPFPVDEFLQKRPQFAKVSLGAEDNISWEYRKSIVPLIKKLKNQGFKIVALEQSQNSIPLTQVQLENLEKAALIVGHEVKGIDKKVLTLADQILEIPMKGKKESLNVSVAFGIAVYQLLKI